MERHNLYIYKWLKDHKFIRTGLYKYTVHEPCTRYQREVLHFHDFLSKCILYCFLGSSQTLNISATSYLEWTVLSASYLENTHVLASLLFNPNSWFSYIFHSRRAISAPGQSYALILFKLRLEHVLCILLPFVDVYFAIAYSLPAMTFSVLMTITFLFV